MHRMKAELQLQGLRSIRDIPQDDIVVLPIDVINRSPTDEDDGEYVLLYDQASNTNGLQMSKCVIRHPGEVFATMARRTKMRAAQDVTDEI